jgi:signal transduction histidine kinase
VTGDDQPREASGATARLIISGHMAPLDPGVELAAYRIVQEALTNTIRHGSASRAQVTLRYEAPRVHVRVTDNGSAAPPGDHQGHGIEGMRERAALHGGTVTAGPAPEGGWAVAATLCLDPGMAAA